MPASVRRVSIVSNRSQWVETGNMTSLLVLTCALLGIISPLNAVDTERPEYIHCQSNLECPANHCCVLGPVRYSIPQCRPMQQEDEICRPGSTASVNFTVGYPDGAHIQLTDVHYIMCPCGDGLSCDPKEGMCRNTADKRDENRLFGENDKQLD